MHGFQPPTAVHFHHSPLRKSPLTLLISMLGTLVIRLLDKQWRFPMILNFRMRLTLAMSAALLFAAPSAMAKKGGDHGKGNHGGGKFRGGYQGNNRNYDFGHNRGFYNGGGDRYYAAPRYYAPSREASVGSRSRCLGSVAPGPVSFPRGRAPEQLPWVRSRRGRPSASRSVPGREDSR